MKREEQEALQALKRLQEDVDGALTIAALRRFPNETVEVLQRVIAMLQGERARILGSGKP